MGDYQHILIPLSPVNDGNGRFEAVVTAKPDSQFMSAAREAIDYRKDMDVISSDDPMHGKVDVKLSHTVNGREVTLPVTSDDTVQALHDKFAKKRTGSGRFITQR
jgi:hypothetical protein